MVMSKQGQGCEWRGVSVLSVCVCLCVCGETPVMCFPICLSDCGWLRMCGCISVHVGVRCPQCVSVCIGHRCEPGWVQRG